MSFRAFSISVVLGALTPSLALALPLAQAPTTTMILPAAEAADSAGPHAAIAQAQERLAEIDATITVLQESVDTLQGAARQKAQAAVAGLRAIRQTYRKEIDGIVAQSRQMTADQLAVVRSALAAPWAQFEQSLDRDVATIKLGAEQRKALVEARIKAEQGYWQGVVADLQASAATLTVEQRAAIDARIARIKARAASAEARLNKLGHASQSAWSVLKQGFANSRQTFEETYGKPH